MAPQRVDEVRGGARTEDIRVMSVLYESTGERWRPFSDAVQVIEDIQLNDSPIKGPQTVAWCARFIKENAGSPTTWHQRWLQLVKLQPSDACDYQHETLMKTFEIVVCFDQLAVWGLGGRRVHGEAGPAHRIKYREKVAGVESSIEQSLFAGQRNRPGLMISPQLLEWIAREVKGEAAIMKERRKAREERALQKPAKT